MAEGSRVVLCPYCGFAQQQADKCRDCGGLFEPLSRRATQVSMGPWYVRDRNRPFRPGCSFEVIKKQVQAGKIKPTTIIRGPSTHQFWSVARHVPGLSHLLGYCYKCDAKVKPTDARCPTCLAPFREPWERNELGLLYPSAGEAAAAQRQIDREIAAMTGTTPPPPLPAPSASAAPGGSAPAAGGGRKAGYVGGDLLDEVIGKPAPSGQRVQKATARPVDRSGDTSRSYGAGAGAATATARPGAAIDFTPSERATADTASETGDDAAAPRRDSPVTWVLLLVIVVMLILLVVVLARGTGPSLGPPQQGFTPDPEVMRQALQERANARETPSPASTDSAPEAVAESPASTPAPSPAPKPAPAVKPPAPARPSSAAPAAAASTGPTPEQTRKLTEADRLEAAQKYDEALSLIKATFANVPADKLPKSVDERIKTLEARIQAQKTNKLFGSD